MFTYIFFSIIYLKNEYDIILNKIFHDIDCSNFRWKIEDEEVLGEQGKSFFDKTDYSNNEFQNMIQKKHYPIFLNLQMYYKNSDVNDIKNYDQFLTSSCQLILFIVDNVFVEIYAKNQTILEKISKNAVDFDFSDIEYINESLDTYKKFSRYCQLLSCG